MGVTFRFNSARFRRVPYAGTEFWPVRPAAEFLLSNQAIAGKSRFPAGFALRFLHAGKTALAAGTCVAKPCASHGKGR
jgi:hypothetical protein